MHEPLVVHVHLIAEKRFKSEPVLGLKPQLPLDISGNVLKVLSNISGYPREQVAA